MEMSDSTYFTMHNRYTYNDFGLTLFFLERTKLKLHNSVCEYRIGFEKAMQQIFRNIEDLIVDFIVEKILYECKKKVEMKKNTVSSLYHSLTLFNKFRFRDGITNILSNVS